MSFDKKEAAQYLGITVRGIENLVGKGRIHADRVKGARGVIEWRFEPDELERYKRMKRQTVYVDPEKQEEKKEPDTALAAPQDTAIITRLVAALETITRAAPPVSVPIEAKLTLSLAEASQLSGFSADHLREAIRAELLKTVPIGASGKRYRIRRADLDRYIKQL